MIFIRAGLASACGAAFADLTYAMIALSVGTLITPVLTAHTAQAHTVTAIRPHPLTSGAAEMPNGSRQGLAPLFTTYALTAVNPFTVIAFVAFIGQLPADASTATRAVAAAGLFTGSLCVQIVLALGGVLLGRVLTAGRGMQMLNVVSGTGILLFGIVGLFG